MRNRTNLELKNAPYPVAPPAAYKILNESRAFLDIASMPFSFASGLFEHKAPQDSLPIILLPGFASDERYLKPLEIYLRKLGFQCEGWGLGINLGGANLEHTMDDLSDRWTFEFPPEFDGENYKGEGGVPFLCDMAYEHIQRRIHELNSPVNLVGWSLGGFIAREVARDLPNGVSQVVTMGSPIIGGPKYTKGAAIFKAKGQDLDWIESEIVRRDENPIQQPITAIYSKTDAVVDWRATIDKVSPNVEHIEVNAAHLGMGFNRKIWKLIAATLATPAN